MKPGLPLALVLFLGPCPNLPRESEPRTAAVQRPAGAPRASFELRLVFDEPASTPLAAITDDDGHAVFVSRDVVLTDADVTAVEVGLDSDDEHYAITLHFKPEGAQRLHQVTSANVGKRLAVIVDHHLLMTPRIMAPLDSTVVITRQYSKAAATRLAEQLAP